MFFNISNHPSGKWSEKQKAAATEIGGEITDVVFPIIPPEASSEEVWTIAESIVSEVLDIISDLANETNVAHVMGEMVCTFDIVSQLQAVGIKCVASTSVREVRIEKDDDGKEVKVAKFNFVRFREY